MEKRETDGGWCKLWMQPAISKRKRKAETSSHAYQITHLPRFLIMVREQARIQSGLCVCACEKPREALTHSSMSACVELRCAVKHSLNLI